MSGIKRSVSSSPGAGRAWEEAASARDHVLFCAVDMLHVCQSWLWNMQHSNSRTSSCRMRSREPGTLDTFFTFDIGAETTMWHSKKEKGD